MAINETIASGKYRQCIDEINKIWKRYSLWNKAADTECEDGQTVEEKVGAIKGITTDLNVTDTGYAADVTMLTQLYSDMSVRYDQESDYVQLYNGASWINWMQGGLQFLNFLRLAENQWDIRDNNASHTFEIANGKLSMTAVPKTDGGNIIADCTYPVDLTNKKRITIKGRVYLYTTAQAVISIGSYRYTTPQAPSKWVDISTIGDLSDLSGVSELGITLPCYEGYTASQIQLTTLLIE